MFDIGIIYVGHYEYGDPDCGFGSMMKAQRILGVVERNAESFPSVWYILCLYESHSVFLNYL